MTPEQGRAFWASLTPEQREKALEQLRPLAELLARTLPEVERMVGEMGAAMAAEAEEYANRDTPKA